MEYFILPLLYVSFKYMTFVKRYRPSSCTIRNLSMYLNFLKNHTISFIVFVLR